MTASNTRGAAIAAKCKDCIYDAAAAGTWAEQVSCCPCTDCPLWQFRPLSRNAPAWIKSHDPAGLPEGWKSLHHDEAIRRLRGAVVADLPDGAAPRAHGRTRDTKAMVTQRGTPDAPKRASSGGTP